MGKVHMGKVGKKILRRKIIQHRMKKLLEDEEELPCEKFFRKKKDSSRELVREGDADQLHCISETSEESAKENDLSEEQTASEENTKEDESLEDNSREVESAEKKKKKMMKQKLKEM